MKRKTSKTFGVLLSAAMLVGLMAGCGNSDNKTGDKNSGGSSDKGGLKPITLSYFAEDPSPNWNNMQDAVGKQITKKTGVTLDAEFAVGDPVQKVSLIAASGEYPDLISAKGDIGKMVDAGAMIDLTELIDKYAPNIKKVLGPYMNRLRYSNSDPSIYVIPSWDGVDQTSFNAGGGFELQHAVVKELGYPEIKTVQDFENAIKAYKDKHPTIDGKKTIGLTLNADDWHMYISVTNPAFLSTGAPDDGEYYINPETYEATYHFLRPEEKDYFKWLNHMNDIGLLDPESFVQKYDQYKAKVATGAVLGLIDQDWDYGDGEKALKAAGKFERGYGHYPVQLTTETKDNSFHYPGFSPGWGVGITTSCKDPVRAIKFLDYLASDEGQILNNWGIEGADYNVDGGKRIIPDDVKNRKVNDATAFQKERGIGLYSMMSTKYGDGVKDSTGNYYTTNFPEQITASFNDVEKEVLAAYKATTWKDLFPDEDEFEPKPWGRAYEIPVPANSELAVLETKMKDITWKRIPEMILAKPSQFDAKWDAYMKQLEKAGVKKMNEEKTKLVKDRVKLWSGK